MPKNRRYRPSFSPFMLAVFFPVALWLAAAPTPAQESSPPDPRAVALEKALGEIDRAYNGRIVVGGSVLDGDTGRPLSGVRLVITVGRFDPTAESLRSSETIRQTIDGAFRYECEGCADLRVRFLKEGYHSEVRSFLAADAEGARPSLNRGALAISLRPVGEAAELVSYRGRLVVAASPDKSRVLALGDRPRGPSSLEKARSRAEKSGEPLLYLGLRTELNEKGAPLAVPHESILGQSVPVAATVDFSTADGGVIPYRPRSEVPAEIRREMMEAPSEGYRETLTLDPGEEGFTWFYVRVGELYGRGLAHPPVVETTSTGRRLVVPIEVSLNPDGSRNLETVE